MPIEELEERLQQLLFDSMGGRRFTQDSPVMPDVWMAYARKGKEPQSLLISPDRSARSGEVARAIREGVKARSGRQARVAHLPGIVLAGLDFDEMLRHVLPRTAWWRHVIGLLRGILNRKGGLLPLTSSEVARIASDLSTVEDGQFQIAPKDTSPPDLLVVILVASLIRSGSVKRIEPTSVVADFFNGVSKEDAAGTTPADIFRVSLNRPAELAVTRSALAVKADAARKLFDVSCKGITWAVIDSGIDGTHPAFIDQTAWLAKKKKGKPPSRVVRTYDFTRVSELLDPGHVKDIFDQDDHPLRLRMIEHFKLQGAIETAARQAARIQIKQLRDRLLMGLEIDWALLEPFLELPDPEEPKTGHGTLVAGILGADWRKDGEPFVTGLCPDIRLIDMRILDPGGHSNEFDVISALQFIRYLNSRADSQVIHGANLSIATIHDVTAYACGSTLVCEECDRTWASGVVLVAAAGNRGHQTYRLADHSTLGGYSSISITDPGNAEGVITVGSTHRLRPHQYGVSYFSGRGPTGDGRRKPDIVAPGEKIEGPVPNGMGSGDGTSLAAPHVSAGAAMLMARHSELIGRPNRIRQILCDTATDLGREPYFQGAGMLDILRALQSI